ncbi:hypothetical protein J4467_02520 [Candidatus Woesearchaeota archaeon]|nr:hypothetical protein [Candidatus Woesearchaeota archaeon]
MDINEESFSEFLGTKGLVIGFDLGIVLGYGLAIYDAATGNQYGAYDSLQETLNLANEGLEKAIVTLSAGAQNMKTFSGILGLSFFTGEIGYKSIQLFKKLRKPEVQ